MKNKTIPIFSLSSLIVGLFSLVSLGLVIVSQGWTIFSPGKLSAKSRPDVSLEGFLSHADFENECQLCHNPLKTQQELCQNCHATVKEQITNKNGLHGGIDNPERCSRCHPDHQGRDFDPGLAAIANFNHGTARFSLIKHSVDYNRQSMPCSACHEEKTLVLQLDSCANCHYNQDDQFMLQHIQNFGQKCLDCHDGKDTISNFDHQQAAFKLLGKHAQVGCESCHKDDQFKTTSILCVDCHSEPDGHKGLFASSCQDCHTPNGWIPAQLDGQTFDHLAKTGFSLDLHQTDYSQNPLTCKVCHPTSLNQFEVQTCEKCHTDFDPGFMNPHTTSFGNKCLDCHDGTGNIFDHNKYFPLDGKHTEVNCESCHKNNVFKNTPSQCSDCHADPVVHAGFYGLECQNCHTTAGWKPANFDHTSAAGGDCQSCHTRDKPANHFEGQCDVCHMTNAWKPAAFDHNGAGAADCQYCHKGDEPANHYAGQCSNCHLTNAWKPATFDHAAANTTDCQSCHAAIKPANHYSGQCSACHTTTAWKPATFDHNAANATDCQSCHESNKPAYHYAGQCSACHSTTAWNPATFDHKAAGATNCQSCHSGAKPAGHYDGQCSACHTTTAWKPATFNHKAAGATNCQSCHSGAKPAGHYDGQCSACHSTTAWKPATFNHKAAGATNCQSCHSGAKPSGHYDGQCSACHSTTAWKPAHFNHKTSNSTDCQSCHRRPGDHEQGQCSKCHNTSNWESEDD